MITERMKQLAGVNIFENNYERVVKSKEEIKEYERKIMKAVEMTWWGGRPDGHEQNGVVKKPNPEDFRSNKHHRKDFVVKTWVKYPFITLQNINDAGSHIPLRITKAAEKVGARTEGRETGALRLTLDQWDQVFKILGVK